MKNHLREFKPDMKTFTGKLGTLGKRNPTFDVGEFLPDFSSESELEIARICLASTTGDVYSIRISEKKGTYIISVYDEYGTDFLGFQEEYDHVPSQGEVFDVIQNMNSDLDAIPYWEGIIENNGFESIQDIQDFIEIDSLIYPDLNKLFEIYLQDIGFKK